MPDSAVKLLSRRELVLLNTTEKTGMFPLLDVHRRPNLLSPVALDRLLASSVTVIAQLLWLDGRPPNVILSVPQTLVPLPVIRPLSVVSKAVARPFRVIRVIPVSSPKGTNMPMLLLFGLTREVCVRLALRVVRKLVMVLSPFPFDTDLEQLIIYKAQVGPCRMARHRLSVRLTTLEDGTATAPSIDELDPMFYLPWNELPIPVLPVHVSALLELAS